MPLTTDRNFGDAEPIPYQLQAWPTDLNRESLNHFHDCITALRCLAENTEHCQDNSIYSIQLLSMGLVSQPLWENHH